MKHLNEPLYILDVDFARSAWKRWQIACHNEARKFDRQLFTREGIEDLQTRLTAVSETCRNHGEIRGCDWDFCARCGIRPSLTIGEGCSVHFTEIAGYYDGNPKDLEMG